MPPPAGRARLGESHPKLRIRELLGAALIVFGIGAPDLHAGPDVRFDVRYPKDVHEGPFTGRVYIFFSRSTKREPRQGPNWFNPEPLLAKDVFHLEADVPIEISTADAQHVLTFPGPLGEDELAGLHAQAVIRFDPWDRRIGTGPGNGYSAAIRLPRDIQEGQTFKLVVQRLVSARRFMETDNLKLLRVRSKLLSDFHGRDVFVQGGVILPASYARQPDRRFPMLFIIPGFGGDHFQSAGMAKRLADSASKPLAVEFIRVVLDPSCPLGHHVFADSANNGPVGQSLVSEFVPELDLRYRTIAAPSARLLTGHSSGGWSSLWLQITYPEVFGGTWSTAPDPVDFRDFQRINLYDHENIFVDRDGQLRPLARRDRKPVLWFKGFSDMEHVLGHGGQLHSFEACFSPRGPDGKPQQVWNRTTGAIDNRVAHSWQTYDVRRVLEDNWQALGPRLSHKLHIHMGDQDTFYLDGAAVLLKQTLTALGSDAVVEIHPGRSHGDLLTGELRARIQDEMINRILSAWPDWPHDPSLLDDAHR